MMLKLSLLIVFVALLACERNDVMTYKVPKQTLLVAQLSQNDSLKTINWIIPDAWIKQPDTEFRLASYQVPALDSSNELGDFSIVNLVANDFKFGTRINTSPFGFNIFCKLFRKVLGS